MTHYDIVVLGGGTAGLVGAHTAAAAGARVALVERERTGGECLWTGCVPSKSLIAAASLAHRMRHADAVGLPPTEPDIDLVRVMAHVRAAQAEIAPQDSPERLRDAGVIVETGHGRLDGPRRVTVDGRELATRTVLLATGSAPVLPPVDGLGTVEALTTDTLWDRLDTLPDRLVVLGAGPVGCELAQAFARLGSEVILVEVADRILPKEEAESSELVTAALRRDGVDVRLGRRVRRARGDGDRTVLDVRRGDSEEPAIGRVLVATGRRPRSNDLGLATVGVRTRPDGAVEVDRRLRTTAAAVYAAGDVTGLLPFTHVAAYHAVTATINALFLLRRQVSHRSVPWVTFTDPEVARVGVTEERARRRWGEETVTAGWDLGQVDRAVTEGRSDGLVKLVAAPDGRLVGATIVGPHAGESIAELAAVIGRRGAIRDVAATVHPYPTYAMGVYRAAGEHVRQTLLDERALRVTAPALGLLRVLSRAGG